MQLLRREGLQVGRLAEHEQRGKQEQLADGLDGDADDVEQHGEQGEVAVDSPQQDVEHEPQRDRAGEVEQVRRDGQAPEQLEGPDVLARRRRVARHDQPVRTSGSPPTPAAMTIR